MESMTQFCELDSIFGCYIILLQERNPIIGVKSWEFVEFCGDWNLYYFFAKQESNFEHDILENHGDWNLYYFFTGKESKFGHNILENRGDWNLYYFFTEWESIFCEKLDSHIAIYGYRFQLPGNL